MILFMLVKIEVYFDGEYWCARAFEHDIFTQGKTLDELIANIKEAIELHFHDSREPVEALIISEFKVMEPAKATCG